MDVKWLIETDIFEEGLDNLEKALQKHGCEYKTIKYMDYLCKKTEVFDANDCVVFYGSLNLGLAIRQESWIPGVYLNSKNYLCSCYYSVLGDNILNEKYIMLPFGELLRREAFLFTTLGESGTLFVRPDSGLKSFTGQTVYREAWRNWITELEERRLIDNESLVVVAKPINIIKEWRFVVVENRVVTGCQYKVNGRLSVSSNYSQKAFDCAVENARLYSPNNVWVIDICETSSGDVKVLEIGCFSCAGMYACDWNVLVPEISAMAQKEHTFIRGKQMTKGGK